ncbi:hypothetical protein GY50_1333 [Dehalococcoides mccartyi GY50]|nr:hypothetical protein GY50_1333 [Dehalococcoides mccartyi GY50]
MPKGIGKIISQERNAKMKTLAQLLGELYQLDIGADEILLGDSLYQAIVS